MEIASTKKENVIEKGINLLFKLGDTKKIKITVPSKPIKLKELLKLLKDL